MASTEQNAATSKSPHNQWRDEYSRYYRVGYPLAFTKIAQEPRSLCKAIEKRQLARLEPLSRTWGPSIGRHPPHGRHHLEGPEHQLDDLARAVLLPPVEVEGKTYERKR